MKHNEILLHQEMYDFESRLLLQFSGHFAQNLLSKKNERTKMSILILQVKFAGIPKKF